MSQNSFSNTPTEKLQSTLKTTKFLTGLLAGALITLLVLAAILAYQGKTFLPTLVMPFALSPILLLNYNNMKAIKAELDSRS